MRRAVFDANGQFMLYAPEEYVERALKRGELTEDDDGSLRVVAKPVRTLTGPEKRALVLAKERAKK